MKIQVALECPACGERRVPQLLQPYLRPASDVAVFRCHACGARWGMALIRQPEARAARS